MVRENVLLIICGLLELERIGHTLLSSTIPELDLFAMEKEILKW